MGPSPARRLIPISSEALEPGMYVAELDRSWLHSPFPGAGFLILSNEQLGQLRRVCRYVYIDPVLSETPIPGWYGHPEAAGTQAVVAARNALKDTLKCVAELVRGARRQGVIDLDILSRCASALVDQVVRGHDALHWFLHTHEQGPFLYRRSAGTAAVAVTLGRHLGFDRAALHALATGGLLLDIGKIAVPVPILAKPGMLETEEHLYVQKHIGRGLELVAGRDLPARALEMIAGHHERVDGSGYPHGLSGTEIPVFARIAAIADAFDAMTLNRRYAAAMSPNAALRQLDVLRNQKFDAALITELILAMGVYPVGTLVELVDGRRGLVCGQRPRQPLQPHVIITHDGHRQPLAEAELAAGEYGILRALPPRVVTTEAVRLEPALRTFYRQAA
jgi:HD-GYP domain-containing protein (c-di-GMP phosphodiesterase class II)